MTSITVKVEAGKVTQSLTNIGEAAPRIVNADIEQAMDAAVGELQQPGDPITYPVHWDSERQRRAFFATDGFGRGIPTKRTGAYQEGWHVTKTGSGTARAYTVSNPVKYARYVGGAAYGKQSNIHAGRWKVARDIIRAHAEAMLTKVRADVHNTVHSGGYGL